MRLALGLSYRGQAYQGWQSQPSGLTVQDRLEFALSTFADEPIRTLCAGRTDAGVHGLNPVANEFNARNSAIGRRYSFVLRESSVRPSLEAGLAGWVFRPLDAAAMQRAAEALIGEHDFSA